MGDDEKVSAERRAAQAAYRREYKKNMTPEQRERAKAYQREWVRLNPEKNRQHSRDSARRAREKEAKRVKENERQKAWRDANPEHVRERSEQWRKANLERAREISRDSYHRRKEANAEKQRGRLAELRKDPARQEKHREYQRANREKINARQRELRAANREKVNAYQRERKQIIKRRVELGLPEIKRHRVTKNDRAQYARESAAFYGKKVTQVRLERLQKEAAEVSLQARGARAEQQLTIDSRNDQVLAGYLAHLTVRARVEARLKEIDHPQLREDLRMDLIARQARGGPRGDVDQELRKIALKDVLTDLRSRIKVPLFVPGTPTPSPVDRDATRAAITERIKDHANNYDTGPHTPSIGEKPQRNPSRGR